MGKPRSKNFLKRYCDPAFVAVFQDILYDPDLTWASKCLAFALLDQPSRDHGLFAKIARKFGKPKSAIARWRKTLAQLPKFDYIIYANFPFTNKV